MLAAAAAACTLHLAGSGSDAWSGASATAPFATLPRAYAAALAALDAGCADVRVRVAAGAFAAPWVVPRARARAAAVTFVGAGAATVLSGGITVANFTAAGGGVWRARVPPGTDATQLFVGGARRPRARAPNVVGDAADAGAAFSAASTFAWAAPLCPPPACAAADPANGGGLVFAPGDAIDAAWNFTGAEVTAFVAPWSTCVERVRAVFAENRTVLFAARCGYAVGAFSALDTGRRWFVENVRGALDAPGEWFLNVSEATLEYMPLPGEALDGFSAVLAQNGSLLVVNQDGVAFEDMTVAFAAIDASGGRSAFAQSAAIEVNASGVALRRVTVAHTGANCVVLRPGVARFLLANSTLRDCGGHGVYMDTQDAAADVLITDVRVHGVGYTYLSQPTGILLNGGANITAAHNEIINSSYTGISVAWMHGTSVPLTPAPQRFNISYNAVADFGRGILSDFAGVRVAINNGDSCFLRDACYVPTLVQNNVITRGRHFAYGANGLYTDNAVAGVAFLNNIISDVDGMGFQPHCGVNNSLTNSLFFDARAERNGACSVNDTYTAVVAGCNGWRFANGSVTPAPFAAALARNIFVTTRCFLFGDIGIWPNPAPFYPGALASTNFSSNDNVFFAAPGALPLRFPRKMSLEAWRAASGNDGASVVGDPLLRDPARGDFSLLPGSPAWALGWRAIDTSNVGPRAVV